MSWEATTAVIKKSRQKGSGLLTMLVLGNYADRFGYAWPSVRTLAQDTKLSERSIQYLERKARQAGELEVFPRQGPLITRGPAAGQRTSLFRIVFCEMPPPGHPYFKLKRARIDCTTSDARVEQSSVAAVQPDCTTFKTEVVQEWVPMVQSSVKSWCKALHPIR